MALGTSEIRLLPVKGTLATLAIDGPASATWNTIIQAKTPTYEGAVGNTITLAAAIGGTWVPNIGTLTLAGNAVAAETVTIGTTVYTWRAALTTVAFEVLVGADASASLDNLIAAINLAAGSGTLYGSLTTVHPTVRAFAGAGDTMVVQTKSNTTLTAVGTLIATTETMTQGSWGATTLADGTDGTNVTFVVSGTAISCTFAGGYSTVSDFEAALAADASVSALVTVSTVGTTPLYQLVVVDDDFSATNLSGGGAAASTAPSGSNYSDATLGQPIPFLSNQAIVLVRSVAGSGTMTATIRLWGYFPSVGRWYSLGQLNNATALGEVETDLISHAELIVGIRRCTRLYAEINSLGGTGTEVEVYADCVRSELSSR